MEHINHSSIRHKQSPKSLIYQGLAFVKNCQKVESKKYPGRVKKWQKVSQNAKKVSHLRLRWDTKSGFIVHFTRNIINQVCECFFLLFFGNMSVYFLSTPAFRKKIKRQCPASALPLILIIRKSRNFCRISRY